MPADRSAPPTSSLSPDSPQRLAIDIRSFPWVRRLASDYAYDFPAVASFFSGDPADRSAWAGAVERTQAHARRRTDIAAVVAAQQQRRDAPPRAREAGQHLADARTVAVVTGQQAGLFGGPLFTLLKALTAIKLADRVSREQGVPAVAIFWVDAEDHDWNEVRSCTVLDADLTPRTVSLPARTDGDQAPVSTVLLDDAIITALGELESLLPPTEFRSALIADLGRHYTPGRGMAEAFCRWLEHLLGSHGLIVYDASDVASKPLVADVFARELSTAGHTMSAAATAGAALAARGYHAQVHAGNDSTALFRLGSSGGGRRPIRRQDGQLSVGEECFTKEALAARASAEPTGFSPNVLLRPIVQDTLFPTVCYVAGPSELAYLGQLRNVYSHFGLPMPLVYPRVSATLVDSATLRFLTRSGLALHDLQPQDDAALNGLLAAQLPPAVEAAFSEAGAAIDTQMTRVIGAIPAIDPTLEGAAKSTLARMQHDLQTLHGKMIQAAKRRDETLRRQFTRARALTFPAGHAQERTFGFVSFLNQYGPALVERLEDELPLDVGRHWVVTI